MPLSRKTNSASSLCLFENKIGLFDLLCSCLKEIVSVLLFEYTQVEARWTLLDFQISWNEFSVHADGVRHRPWLRWPGHLCLSFDIC